MDYREMLTSLDEVKKTLTVLVDDSRKEYATVKKGLELGDLKTADKKVQELEETMEEARASLTALKEGMAAFDRADYVASGAFKRQIVEECRKAKLDVKEGEGLTLEIFPNKLSINPETQEVTVDKKKSYCLNPSVLVETIRKTQEKLAASNFNEERFLKELSTAYEQHIAIESSRKGKKVNRSFVKLTDLYKLLAPTARAKKDYDMQSYAYDLSRLFNAGNVLTKDGYALEWDTSRNLDKGAIRILDGAGNENYLKSLRFTESEY